MKTGTVTIRLPMDKIERLKEMAKQRECSVTELLREPISIWLDLGAIGAGSSDEVIGHLEEMKAVIGGSQQALVSLLMGVLAGTASTRYYAAMAATFGDEMTMFIKDGTKLTEDQRNQRAAEREQQALMNESMLIKEVIESQQQPIQEEA